MTTTDTRARADRPPDEKLLRIIDSFIDVAATQPTKFNEFFHALEQHIHAHGLRERLEEQRKHGGHMHGCAHIWRNVDCDCGYVARVADLERELKEAEGRT